MITPRAIVANAAGKFSEDAYGHIGNGDFGAAWVIDGATGLGDREYTAATGAYSDAAWYAQELSRALFKFSLEPVPAEKIFLAAIRQVAEHWYAVIGETDVPRYALPSAAGIWLRWQGDTIEAVSLGDCRGWYASSTGAITQLGMLDEEPNDIRVAQAVTQFQQSGVTYDQMRGALLEGLRARRGTMNEPHGYPIFSIHEETIRHLQPRAWQIGSGHIVLCSDGLFRWDDVLRQGHTEDFLRAATGDLYGTLARVREIENADANCTAYPRLKRHDDATGIVLSCQTA